MSSEAKSPTRTRILDAAQALAEARPGADLGMGAIARAAGVSRQALYLVFSDKTDLFVALVRHVDEKRGLAAEIRSVTEAPDALTALREMVSLQVRMNPGVHAVAAAFDGLRRSDPAAEQAWQDRLANRLNGSRGIAERLKADGLLRPGLDVAEAADLIWTLTSLRQWEDLVVLRGWSAETYRTRTLDLLKRALLTPEVQ